MTEKDKKPGQAEVVFEDAETAPEPETSTLGERMSDMSGIRVLRNGKWENVVPKSDEKK
jgi:hypothetical protein